MSIQAFVLIQAEVRMTADVAAAVRTIPGVLSADEVTGPYDVIAKTETDTVDHLGRLVASQIQRVEGITRTLTCPILRL